MLYHKIDLTTGLFIEDTLISDIDTIDIPCPEGFYHPKWDFTTETWMEGMAQAEIDAILSAPHEPGIEDRIDGIEYALLMMI